MEAKTVAAAAQPLYTDRDGERGGGGKFKKPPSRKLPASPYARPLAAPANRAGRGGWLAKLVDPAYRLISGGVTRIIPSFFSELSSDVPPPLLPITKSNDTEEEEVVPSAKDDEKCTSSSEVFKATERKDNNELLDKGKTISQRQEKPENSHDDSSISRIEQLMKGKTFSREEILHLTEILKSKATDDLEKDTSNMTAGRDTEGVPWLQDTPRRLTERRQEDVNRALLGSLTPLPRANVQDEVGASPIDVARAYMGSRMPDQIPGSHSFLTKDKHDPENAYKPYLPPPSPKPSPCWPGTMAREQQGYTTPQNHRSRFGLHDFPRTPYSRTLLSKSRTKPQGDSRCLDLSVKTYQQSQTSTYGQVRTNNDVSDYSYGSVGPMRRIRNKLGSEPRSRKSIFLNPSKAASPIEKSLSPQTSFPAFGKNKEIDEIYGASKSNSVDHRVYTHEKAAPTEATRIILEHLNWYKPTPREKAEELKLATGWKKSSFAEVSDDGERGIIQMNSQVLKTTELGTTKSFKNGDSEKGIIQMNSGGSFKATIDSDTTAPGMKTNANAGTSLFSKNTDSQVKFSPADSSFTSSYQNSIGNNIVPRGGAIEDWSFQHQSNGQKVVSTLFNSVSSKPAHTSGSKPTLSSIAINKPDPRRGVFSDNGIGFSFPVPTSSGALSEPPTPSMPSSAAKVASHPGELSSAVPTYSFGTTNSSKRVVFSFPSTSSVSVHAADASDIKFNFGADGKSRLSFGAVGKAVC